MMGCLQSGYNITRQSVVAIIFLYLWGARFFSADTESELLPRSPIDTYERTMQLNSRPLLNQ